MRTLLAVFVVGLVAFAPAASAQGICDQYPDLPQCVDPGGDEGGNQGDEDEGVVSAGPTADLGDGGGELPFTGYPLTPLVLFLLALLAVGLLLRSYMFLRARASHRTPPSAR